MRLIDADAFIKRFHNGNSDTKAQKLMNSTVRRMIREQPTAYPTPDEVVQQLKHRSTLARPVGWTKSYEIVTLKDAIEIVKGGGVDAKTDS